MNTLKLLFPFSFQVKEKDVVALVISIVIYIVIGAVFSALTWVIGLIPIVKILAGVVGTVSGIYCLSGIILSVLNFLNVLK